jgi:hypothetical protein
MSEPTKIFHITCLRLAKGFIAAWEKWLIAQGVQKDALHGH